MVGHLAAVSTIYFNDGSGRRYSPVSFGDANGDVYGFAIADLDQDGRLDIAVARSKAQNVVYFAGPAPPEQPEPTRTTHLTPASPQLERRDQAVTADDLSILVRAPFS